MNNYSQCHQDLFAYIINNGQPGFFLDIGCNKPDWINNSQLLRENGWQGVCIDQDDYSKEWAPIDSAKFFQCDVTNKSDLHKILTASVPDTIDYLSLDIDEENHTALANIDFDRITVKCATVEHAFKSNRAKKTKHQHDTLNKYGYQILCNNINHYEDWVIHPSLVKKIRQFEPLKKLSNLGNKPKIKQILVDFWGMQKRSKKT